MDRASVLFQQIEERVIEVAWMWAEVQQLLKEQNMPDVKDDIYMEVTVKAIRDGKVFSTATTESTALTQEQFHAAEGVLAQAMLSLGDKQPKK